MSYIVNRPDGTLLTTILDGTIDNTSCSLTLVGRNYSGYGEIIAEDLVALLVNFANNVAPNFPNTGQLWYDTAGKVCKIYTGTAWKTIGSATSAATPPNTTVSGDLWWDNVNKQLYGYDGTTPFNAQGWILIGPGYSSAAGKSGALFEQLSDGVNWHDVVSIYLDGVRTSIISQDAFTPNISITGFTSLAVGYNMSTSSTLGTIWGVANNASYLGGVPSSAFFRADLNNYGTGSLTLTSNAGVTLGTISNFVSNVQSSTGDGQLWNTRTNANLNLYVTSLSGPNKALTVNGSDGRVYVSGDPTQSLGVATKQYVDNKFNDTVLYGIPTAPTAPAGTSNAMVATTEFVTSGLSGLVTYKIYQNNSWMWINDTGTGSANLVIDGTTVLTATSSGVVLNNGATATTQGQTYNALGNNRVATTQFVKTATQWWGGSAKFVSNVAPNPGVNDIGSNDGDFWFQYAN